MPDDTAITLVCCSYNRAAALRATVPSKLEVEGVSRFLFVLDGSTDESLDYLSSVAERDSRVEVLMQPHAGVQATRNFAVSAVSTPWVLFVDDDDLIGPDFATELLASASRAGADIAGAPWFNAMTRPVAQLVELSRAKPLDRLSFRSHPSVSTRADLTSPFLFSTILARTAALRSVGYDSAYRGNSWREETDMFLRAMDAGYGLVRSANVYSWQEHSYRGGHGQRYARLRTEWWVLVNEARFLRRHRRTLSQLEDQWRGWPVECLRTVAPRLVTLGRAACRRVTKRIRAAS